jgi:outer membrane lipoprotein-sorting protein
MRLINLPVCKMTLFKVLSFPLTAAISLLAIGAVSPVHAQSGDEDVHYVIERYIDGMGGRAALERIRSVRLGGTVRYPDGTAHAITVLKKKPNKVRVILDTGILRFTQAYDGETAWFARESGKYSFHDRLRGSFAESFIREAPLENILVNPGETEVDISLGPEVSLANSPCFQVIATFPDRSKVIHYIEKESFLERRILEYDAEGTLVSELVPGKFEIIDSVAFALQIIRLKDGETLSTLTIEEVQTNVGILDTAFSPPVELPPQ